MATYISLEELRLVHDLIHHRDIEVCGNLLTAEEMGSNPRLAPFKPVDNRLVLFTTDVGTTSSCQNSTKSKYIWHTHSVASKGYPSPTDFLKPLKYPTITASFVFTRWGIWEIRATDRTGQWQVQDLQPICDQIYKATDRGRANPLTAFQIQSIRLLIGRLESLMNGRLSVMFTPWEDVKSFYLVKG